MEASPLGHYEQTSKWARVKAIYGWRPIRLQLIHDGVRLAGAQVLVKRPSASLGIGYLTKGPVFDNGDPAVLSTLLGALRRVARSYRIHYLMSQPPDGALDLEGLLRRAGFRDDPAPDVVLATTRIDLTRDLEEIFSNMSKNNRRFIRHGERRGVEVRPGDRSDIPYFYEMMLETCKRQGVAPNPPDGRFAEALWEVFGDAAGLFLAECRGKIVSALFTIAFRGTLHVIGHGGSAWRAGRSPDR